MFDLTNKNALITGSSRGIGRGIALKLAEAGARVLVTYNTHQQGAEDVVNEIKNGGGNAIAILLDLSKPETIAETLKMAVQSFGPLDILVNNAGMAQEKPFTTITLDDFDTMMHVNLYGAMACTQALVDHMLDQKWGRIINIASIGGQWGGTNQVHYAMAKAGLINFSRSIAKLYAQNGITSNVISPGLVETDMVKRELTSTEGQKKVAAIPLGRIATMDEITSAAVYLASDEAGYVTGQTMDINGGMLMR